jgi:hypothetical protein
MQSKMDAMAAAAVTAARDEKAQQQQQMQAAITAALQSVQESVQETRKLPPTPGSPRTPKQQVKLSKPPLVMSTPSGDDAMQGTPRPARRGSFAQSDITKVVITGGPCGGKSSCLASLEERLQSLGYEVYLVPEASTLMKAAGCGFPFADDQSVQLSWEEKKIHMQVRYATSPGRLALRVQHAHAH